MILEENFIQMQHTATTKYIKDTAHRYSGPEETAIAFNAYIQGRVDGVADMERLVDKHNLILKERNKLQKELDKLRKGSEDCIPPSDDGLGL